MLDLAVVNGFVFVEGGFRKVDIGIRNGKFAMITIPGGLPEAARTIDAEGKHVLPGGIDTHVHYRDPGHWERETFEVGSRAAAARPVARLSLSIPSPCPPSGTVNCCATVWPIARGENHPANDRHEKGVCVDFCFFGAAGGEHPEAHRASESRGHRCL